MSELRLRPMTEAELEAYLRDAIGSYADAHVAAGSWAAEGAKERSAAEFAQLLPGGTRDREHAPVHGGGGRR